MSEYNHFGMLCWESRALSHFTRPGTYRWALWAVGKTFESSAPKQMFSVDLSMLGSAIGISLLVSFLKSYSARHPKEKRCHGPTLLKIHLLIPPTVSIWCFNAFLFICRFPFTTYSRWELNRNEKSETRRCRAYFQLKLKLTYNPFSSSLLLSSHYSLLTVISSLKSLPPMHTEEQEWKMTGQIEIRDARTFDSVPRGSNVIRTFCRCTDRRPKQCALAYTTHSVGSWMETVVKQSPYIARGVL
jgi:hypothetical protein